MTEEQLQQIANKIIHTQHLDDYIFIETIKHELLTAYELGLKENKQ